MRLICASQLAFVWLRCARSSSGEYAWTQSSDQRSWANEARNDLAGARTGVSRSEREECFESLVSRMLQGHPLSQPLGSTCTERQSVNECRAICRQNAISIVH